MIEWKLELLFVCILRSLWMQLSGRSLLILPGGPGGWSGTQPRCTTVVSGLRFIARKITLELCKSCVCDIFVLNFYLFLVYLTALQLLGLRSIE